MQKFHVYILTLVKSKIFYIGSTSNLDTRLKDHIRKLNNKSHYNLVLQSNYEFNEEILINSFEMSNRESAYNYEEKLINQVFNSTRKHLLATVALSAKNGVYIENHPDKNSLILKRNLSQRKAFDKMSKEELKSKFGKLGCRNGMYGKTHTEEVRRKISLAHKGHSYNKGCKLSPEHIEKIRQRQKLRTGSKNSFFGKKHSEETKEKLRLINIGKANPNCHKKIMAEGIEFINCGEAARYFNISAGLVTYRLKSEKYKTWHEIK